MPRDSNGNYTKPNPSVVAGTTVQAAYENTNTDDQATELTDSLSRSGKGGMLEALKLADSGANFVTEVTTGLRRVGSGDARVAVLGTDVLQYLQASVNALVALLTTDDGVNFQAEPNSGMYRNASGDARLRTLGTDSLRFKGYSADAAEAQNQRDPGTPGSEILATSVEQELLSLRYAIAQSVGQPYWYSRPSIASIKEPRYGAVGDDATDNATAIQSCINENDIIFCGDKASEIFRVAAEITIPGNKVLLGSGKIKNISTSQSVLRADGTIDSYIGNIAIKDISIEGGNGGAGTELGAGIRFNYVRDFLIENVKISKGNQRGVWSGHGVSGHIKGNRVEDCGLGWTSTTGGEAIYCRVSQNVIISENFISRSGRHGVNMSLSLRGKCVNNNMLDVGASGFTITGNDDPTTANKSVTSLTRAGQTATATVTAHGYLDGAFVRISGAAQSEYNGTFEITRTGVDTFTYVVSGSPATPATGTILANNTSGQRCVFIGNTVKNAGADGFLIENEAHHTIVANNTLENGTNSGVLISSGHGDGPQGCVVSGNEIRNINAGSNKHGVWISGSPRTVVSANVVENVDGDGIRVNGAESSGTVVSGNVIRNAGDNMLEGFSTTKITFKGNNGQVSSSHGVSLITVSDSLIEGNIIENPDSSASGSGRGILVTSSSLRNSISDNLTIDALSNMQDGIFFSSDSTGNRGAYNRSSGHTRSPVRYGSADNLLTGYDNDVYAVTLAAATTLFLIEQGETHLVDANGAARNYNPDGTFGKGFRITVRNTDTVGTITFDSAGIAVAIAPGAAEGFVYDGAVWVKIS